MQASRELGTDYEDCLIDMYHAVDGALSPQEIEARRKRRFSNHLLREFTRCRHIKLL